MQGPPESRRAAQTAALTGRRFLATDSALSWSELASVHCDRLFERLVRIRCNAGRSHHDELIPLFNNGI